MLQRASILASFRVSLESIVAIARCWRRMRHGVDGAVA